MLDIHRLVLLREVKLRGSMTAAGRELAYSHSAISQQLSLLERETGVPLLERSGRNVLLTPAGEELVQNTEAILVALERAEAALESSSHRVHGTVTVAAFATISRTIMPDVIASLAADHPDLDVRMQLIEPEEALLKLTSRTVDAVITDAYPGAPSMSSAIHSTSLLEDPIRGYLPASVAVADIDLASTRWVMEPLNTASANWAIRVCRERGFDPVIAYESSDLLFHVKLVERGLAAAFLPDMVVRETGSSVQPSSALPSDQHRSIHFVVRQGSETRGSLVALRDALAARLATV